MKKVVFLLHGFRSDSGSMNDLAKFLKPNFIPIMLELPITFHNLEKAVLKLKAEVLNVLKKNRNSSLNFVGHSTGGILMRILLKNQTIAHHTENCVFISVPNHGTVLADLYNNLPNSAFKEIHKPVKYLTKKAIHSMNLKKPDNVNFGGIAGFKPIPLTKKFFDGKNDGLVTVKSVFLKSMNDFVTLPYKHSEIHHKLITCKLVRNYLLQSEFLADIGGLSNMSIANKFITIVDNGYINELCSELPGNISFATMGGKVWWKNLAEVNGWNLQQNHMTRHIRILNPSNIRKAFSSERKIREAIDLVYSRIEIENFDDDFEDSAINEFPNNTEENNANDNLSKIEKLGELLEKGYISEEEFQEKKIKLFSEI